MDIRSVLSELLVLTRSQNVPIERVDIQSLNEIVISKAQIINELLDKGEHIPKAQLNGLIDAIVDPVLNLEEDTLIANFLGRKYFECQKELFVIEILNNLSYSHSALLIARRLVKKSNKYYFLQISFQAYRIIYTSCNRLGQKKEEKEASDKFIKYLHYYTIEKKIELDRNELMKYYDKSESFDEELIGKCDGILNTYEEHVYNIPSFYFHSYYFYIEYAKHLNNKDNYSIYKTAKKASDYFESLDFEYKPGKLLFTFIQIIYCIQKKEYQNGHALISTAFKYVSKKSLYWLNLMENRLLLHLHERKYNEGCVDFFSVSQSQYFLKLHSKSKNRWVLFEAYIRILLEAGVAEYPNRKKNFSIQKFINDSPVFSADKRAMNIPLIIAQMLFLIIRREYNKAIDRIEALEKYASRYLKNDETFRSNCFIKMLVVIPKQGFNRLAVERHAKKYYDRLINSEIELIDQPFEIEIIPYENLWEIALDNLSKKHHFNQRRAS